MTRTAADSDHGSNPQRERNSHERSSIPVACLREAFRCADLAAANAYAGRAATEESTAIKQRCPRRRNPMG
jgi:phosphopentomutase